MAIKVFYHDDLSTKETKFSIPTERKAAEFVKRLRWDKDIIYHGLVQYYHAFDRYTYEQANRLLAKVHSAKFLQKAHPGWGTKDNALAHNIILFKAVQHAENAGIAIAPVSGFHHAGYDYNWGFCTYNGLVAAALALSEQGKRVLILDGDQHEGDGTLDILERLKIGRDKIVNHSVTAWNVIPDFAGFDHVLYQAGADAHYLDGGYLNDDTWGLRDELVFKRAKEHNVPITVTFAGGYSALRKVVDLHLSTYWTATEVYYGYDRAKAIRDEIEGLGSEVPRDISARTRLEIYGELTRAGGTGERPRFRRYSEPRVPESSAGADA